MLAGPATAARRIPWRASGDSVYPVAEFMIALLILGMITAVCLLYAADRTVKARRRAHRLRRMSERLDAATARAEQQLAKRQDAARASTALTSVMPAINRPPLTLPGHEVSGEAPQVRAEPPATS